MFSGFPNILPLMEKSNKALEQQSPSWPIVLNSFPLQWFRGLISSNLVLKSDVGTLTSSKMVVFPQTSLSLASTLFYKASSLTIFCAFAAASSRWYDTKILNLESGAACIAWKGNDVVVPLKYIYIYIYILLFFIFYFFIVLQILLLEPLLYVLSIASSTLNACLNLDTPP